MGKVTITADIGHPNGYTLNFGNDARSRFKEDHVYPTGAGLYGQDPSIDIRCGDLGKEVVAARLAGAQIQVVCHLTQLDVAGGSRKAAGNHVSITATLGNVAVEEVSASGEEDGEALLRVRPLISGANPILTISTTA